MSAHTAPGIEREKRNERLMGGCTVLCVFSGLGGRRIGSASNIEPTAAGQSRQAQIRILSG